jgi:hypothetical protein
MIGFTGRPFSKSVGGADKNFPAGNAAMRPLVLSI